jgi:hypothetical protein
VQLDLVGIASYSEIGNVGGTPVLGLWQGRLDRAAWGADTRRVLQGLIAEIAPNRVSSSNE